MRGQNALRIVVALLATLAAMHATAQTYPDRPVRIVLPFGPGGVADVSSRIIADKLGERLGQRFVIENMPGAGGIIAAKAVLAAPPDGYTLGLVTNGTAITAALFNRLPYDPTADFEMISTLGRFDLVFAVDAASPYKTLADFVTAAKASPASSTSARSMSGARKTSAPSCSNPRPASMCRSSPSAIRLISWSDCCAMTCR
jgi:tripartite-type tricarboxylate transporter receptor subunit TctC